SSPLPAPAAIYRLSLQDALPILGDEDGGFRPAAVQDGKGLETQFAQRRTRRNNGRPAVREEMRAMLEPGLDPRTSGLQARSRLLDRKSTRLNSSHAKSSYSLFCL